MKIKMTFGMLGCFLFYPLIAWTTHHKMELQLYKNQVNSSNDSFLIQRGQCTGQFFIDGGRNYPNLRDFWLNYCLGSYSMTLVGTSGTIVTLFANNNYSDQFGFLIIRKIDNIRIWILDLNEFESRKWQRIKGMKGYGAYEVYFYFIDGQAFSENISSVKWGKWWDQLS